MSPHPGAHASQHQIFADYHQVYLEDSHAQAGVGEDPDQRVAAIDALVAQVLSPEALARHVGVAPGALCVLTARNTTVPVTIEVRAQPPTDELSGWDQVVEASLDVPSGCLVLHGPTDYFPSAPRLTVTPDTYRVRVYFGGLETVSPDQLEGHDHYRLVLWPAPAREPTILCASSRSW